MGLYLQLEKAPAVSLTKALSQSLAERPAVNAIDIFTESPPPQIPSPPWEVYRVLDQCQLALIAGQVPQQQLRLHPLNQTLTLVVVLEGSVKLLGSNYPECEVPEGHITLIVPREDTLTIEFDKSARHVALFLDLDTPFLLKTLNTEELSRLGRYLDEVYESSRFFQSSHRFQNQNPNSLQNPRPLQNLRLPLTRPIYDIVYNLVHSPRSVRFRQMLVESRANELVAIILQDLLSHSRGTDQVDMPADVIRGLRKAHQIVIENFASPPTLSQLSRQVGMNRNKLSRGFKLLYGATIFEYCHSYRMNLAQTLLRKNHYSIAHVAELTGYEHPGNFTTAYKRYYGELPKQARMQG